MSRPASARRLPQHDHACRSRSIAVVAGAAAMIGIPLLGPLVAGTEEGAAELDTEITPPDYAFAVWAPIFVAAAANAVQHTRNPDAPVNVRTGWWLAAGHLTAGLWSVAAQSGRWRSTPYVLTAAASLTGVAFARAQQAPPERRSEQLPASSAGLLLGWISVASVVNAFATQRDGTYSTSTPTGRRRARAAVAASAVALSGVVAVSRHGSSAVAASAGWALVTSAANPERTRATRAVSALGAVSIAAAALAGRVGQRGDD